MTAAMFGCYACRTLFGYKDELASLPGGNKFAFDPMHGRVWRICTNCGDWGLLGPETSAIALPELQMRFAAVPSQPFTGLAVAHMGSSLELLRIGETGVRDYDDVAALKRKRQITRYVAFATPALALCGLALAAAAVFMSRLPSAGRNLIGLLVTTPMVFLGMGVIRIRHDLPVRRWLMVAGAVVLLTGLILMQRTDPSYGLLAMTPVLAIAAVLALKLRPFAALTVPLPRGGAIRFYSITDLPAATMSWSPDTEVIALHDLPGGRAISGTDAEAVLRKLVMSGVGMRLFVGTRQATDDAHDLLRAVGGRRGLLHALDGFRRDQDERIEIAKLPKVYLLALDLALAPGNPDGPDHPLQRTAAEAAQIAAEAEALDRDLLT